MKLSRILKNIKRNEMIEVVVQNNYPTSNAPYRIIWFGSVYPIDGQTINKWTDHRQITTDELLEDYLGENVLDVVRTTDTFSIDEEYVELEVIRITMYEITYG